MKTKMLELTMAVVLLAVFCGGNSPLNGQARFQSKASGTWAASSTWLLVTGSSSTGYPGVADTAEIMSGFTVSTAGTSVDCATLTVRVGGTLSIAGIGSVRVNGTAAQATVSGTVQMSSTGSLRSNGSGSRTLVLTSTGKITISGAAAFPVFTVYNVDTQSTFEFMQSGAQTVQSGIVYGNLTLGGSGTKTVGPVPADSAFRCAGTLTIAGGVTFDVSTNILRIYFMGNVNNSGTIDASVGTTMLWMTGSQWVNNGTYLASATAGGGYQPETHFNNTAISGTPVAQTFYDFVVDGPVTTSSDLTVGRHFIISAGGSFSAGPGRSHTVKGNWQNSGSFDGGTSTVTLNGTSTQTVNASTFYQLVVNDTAGVSLSGDVSIASGGSLTLTKGNVAAGSHMLSINSPSAGALAPGANKITGTVKRAIAAGSSGTYQLFDANSYFIPSGTGNPTSVTATVYPNSNPPNLPPQADTSLVVKRYVTLSAVGAGTGFSYTLRFSYLKSEVRGPELNYVIWKNSGAGWQNVGVSSVDTTNHFIQMSGLSGFGDVTAADPAGALPIQLVSFVVTPVPNTNDVKLTWTTATEVNNYGFFVQRSFSATDGFADLPNNFILGNGSTLAPRHYEWTDKDVPAGKLYYRLKQVDLDGTITYYGPQMVQTTITTGLTENQGPLSFSLAQNWPNPFNPSTTISYQLPSSSGVRLVVYDLVGREVATLVNDVVPAGTHTVKFDGSNLASGTYVYRIEAGSFVATRKLMLVK
jgi:hypothetical protein